VIWTQKFPQAVALRSSLSTKKPVTMRPTTAEIIVRLTAHPAAMVPTMGERWRPDASKTRPALSVPTRKGWRSSENCRHAEQLIVARLALPPQARLLTIEVAPEGHHRRKQYDEHDTGGASQGCG
jgi:hypothetical protein